MDLPALGATEWTVGERRALLIVQVDKEPEGAFTGRWVDPDLPNPTTHDGSLVAHLTPIPNGNHPPLVDVRLVLAHNGGWYEAGMWPEQDQDWPEVLRPTCRTITHLLTCPIGHDTAPASGPQPADDGA